VAASDPFKEDVKVQMNDVALTDWLMRIVNVSGLDEDALSSGNGGWIEESPINLDKDEQKKPIIGTHGKDASKSRYERSSTGLYGPIPIVSSNFAKSSLAISTLISSSPRLETP